MPQNDRTYIAIDLKSYYASVECMERGLDPMQTNLVVADPSRTEKTICLAVSPALKAYGIPGRARLFEVVERVRQVNAERQRRAPGGRLTGKSADDLALKADASLAVDYLVAPPRMAKYIEVSMQMLYTQVPCLCRLFEPLVVVCATSAAILYAVLIVPIVNHFVK